MKLIKKMLTAVEKLNDLIKNVDQEGGMYRLSTFIERNVKNLLKNSDVNLLKNNTSSFEDTFIEAIEKNDDIKILSFLIENHEGLTSIERLLITLFKKYETQKLLRVDIITLINLYSIRYIFIEKHASKDFINDYNKYVDTQFQDYSDEDDEL